MREDSVHQSPWRVGAGFLIRTYGCKFFLIYILQDQKLWLTCWRKMNPDMTMMKNSYTMPLLFGVWPEAGALLYFSHRCHNGTSDYSDAKFRLV